MEVRQAQIPLPQEGWGTKQTIMESERLEKPTEIPNSNCSHSTALAITLPCPQVPHPEGWGLHPWAAVPGLGFLFRSFLRSSPNSGPRSHWLHLRPQIIRSKQQFWLPEFLDPSTEHPPSLCCPPGQESSSGLSRELRARQDRARTPELSALRKGDCTLHLCWEHTAPGAGTEQLPANGEKAKVRVELAGNGDGDMRLQPLSPGWDGPADGAPIPKQLSQPCSSPLRKPGC